MHIKDDWGHGGRVTATEQQQVIQFLQTLEGMARYAGQLLAPAKSFGRGFVLPFHAVSALCRPLLCLVVT